MSIDRGAILMGMQRRSFFGRLFGGFLAAVGVKAAIPDWRTYEYKGDAAIVVPRIDPRLAGRS